MTYNIPMCGRKTEKRRSGEEDEIAEKNCAMFEES